MTLAAPCLANPQANLIELAEARFDEQLATLSGFWVVAVQHVEHTRQSGADNTSSVLRELAARFSSGPQVGVAIVRTRPGSALTRSHLIQWFPTSLFVRGGVEIGRLAGARPYHQYVLALESCLAAF
ncbi:MAG: hypothetical protein U0271_36470 [Polyangiaceae bacterium]